MLVTVLGNLIENALDAMEGQPEGEITLLLHYQNGWLSCEVSDDGPGIDPAQLETILLKASQQKVKTGALGCSLPASKFRTRAVISPSNLNLAYLPNFCSHPGIARGISRDKCINCR